MTSSAQLQREADAARVGLADTLGQLRDGVAPSALSGEAIALVKDSGLSILKALSDSARANPVPALLIGAGLTMLLTRTTGSDVMGVATSTLKSAAATSAGAARSAASGLAGAASSAASGIAGAASGAASSVAGAASGVASSVAGAASGAAGAAKDAVKGAADRTANAVMDAAGTMSDRVAGTAVSAHQTAVDSMASVKDRLQSGLDSGKAEFDARRQQAGELADDVTDQAQTMAQQARQSFARLIEEQPILMAALGAALGAAVGAALPLSQSEKDLMGSTGAKAIDLGRGALANAADVVRKEAASADLGARMGQLADKVVQTVTKDVVKPANA
jgi:phage-related protein